jgi:Plasmid encoded RepA protein
MPKQKDHQLNLLAEQELLLQAQEARDADAVGYYTRVLTQTGLPASKIIDNEFARDSGAYHLVIQTPRAFSVPYGIYPRGILAWLITEIVNRKNRKKSEGRIIELGSSLAEFMEKVTGGRTYSGGEFGNIRPFKKQLLSLLTSRILYWEDFKDQTGFLSMEIASAGNLMWHPKVPDQPGLIQSSIEVAEKFWEDCCTHGHPIDFRVVRGLWPNCLAFDIYTWLTYKAYVSLRQHRHEISISWHMLKVQFGPQYKTLFQFRWKFLESWKLVSRLYPSVSLTEQEGKGIQLRFRRPSVISVGLPGSKHLKGQWEPRQRQLPLPPQS